MTGWLEERRAEAFSYAEDGMVTDLLLARHLAHLGIDMQHQRKTGRTVMAMEVEASVRASERLGEWLTLREADRIAPSLGFMGQF
ncbi:Ubiquitin carboxyl-terminal hydrolase 5 [Taenia solium]|eukprot:TsM_000500900 transcript=TsM_000500900 gene=TsM_000500900